MLTMLIVVLVAVAVLFLLMLNLDRSRRDQINASELSLRRDIENERTARRQDAGTAAAARTEQDAKINALLEAQGIVFKEVLIPAVPATPEVRKLVAVSAPKGTAPQ